METKVLNKFINIFENNEKYLIIEGEKCTGKFYVSCQKIILKCLKNKNTQVLIICGYKEYAANILQDIYPEIETIFTNSLYKFKNNSKIKIITRMEKVTQSFDFCILKSADEMNFDIILEIEHFYKKPKQIILTSTPISQNNWLYKLKTKS